MDQAWFLFLNGLPAGAPILGKLAIVVSKYGVVLYPLLLLGLWLRRSDEMDRHRRILLLSVLAALGIGTSRVMIGVHYPSDILGGVLVGVVCAAVAMRTEAPLRPTLNFVLGVARCLGLA